MAVAGHDQVGVHLVLTVLLVVNEAVIDHSWGSIALPVWLASSDLPHGVDLAGKWHAVICYFHYKGLFWVLKVTHLIDVPV